MGPPCHRLRPLTGQLTKGVPPVIAMFPDCSEIWLSMKSPVLTSTSVFGGLRFRVLLICRVSALYESLSLFYDLESGTEGKFSIVHLHTLNSVRKVLREVNSRNCYHVQSLLDNCRWSTTQMGMNPTNVLLYIKCTVMPCLQTILQVPIACSSTTPKWPSN